VWRFPSKKEVSMKKLLPFIFILLACQTQPAKPKFTPPKDGKITKEMADRYVKAAHYLEQAIKEQGKMVDEFREKYKDLLSPDLTELADTAFLRKHPEVKQDWDAIQKRIEEIEKEAYERAGITAEEFDWIANALIEEKNKEIQKYVEEQLSKLKGEEGKPKEVKGEEKKSSS